MAYVQRSHVGPGDLVTQAERAPADSGQPELVGTCVYCTTPFAQGERSCPKCGGPLPLELTSAMVQRGTPLAATLTLGAGAWG